MTGFTRADDFSQNERLFKSMSHDELCANSLAAAKLLAGLEDDLHAAAGLAKKYREMLANMVQAIDFISKLTRRDRRKTREQAFRDLVRAAAMVSEGISGDWPQVGTAKESGSRVIA